MPAFLRLLSQTCLMATLLLSLTALAEGSSGNSADAPADNTQQPTGKEIYKTVDKDGKVIYSSTNPGGEKVELKQTNTITLPRGRDIGTGEPTKEAPRVVYKLLTIDSPKDGHRLTNPELPVSMSVMATVDPRLDIEHGHHLQFYLNDAPYGDPTEATSITLQNLFRGAYSVRVAVVDTAGNELISSASVHFSIFQSSVQNPNSPLNPNNHKPGTP